MRFNYHCSFGPEDYSENLPSSQVLPAGKRNGKVSKGLSVKRGCKARLAIIRFDDGVAEIRMLEDKHTNHGDQSRGEGRHAVEPHLSKGIRSGK